MKYIVALGTYYHFFGRGGARMKIKTILVITLLILLAASNGIASYLTLDDPNPTIVRPASGSLTYDFTGTISLDEGLTKGPITISFAFLRSFNPRNPNVNRMIDADFNPDLRSFTEGFFSGTLFSCNIDSEDFLGLYKYNPDSLDSKPGYTIEVTGEGGAGTPLRANYSINLISGVHKPTTMVLASVPEPTTMLLLSLGLIGLAGVRRKMQR